MFCKNCGEKVNIKDNYCTNCGYKLKTTLETVYSYDSSIINKICDNCKTAIPKKTVYCPFCGCKKRKKPNVRIIIELIIINIAMFFLTFVLFKYWSIFYLLYIFIGMLLSIFTIIQCIKGFYKNRFLFMLLSIFGIITSHILFFLYLVLFFYI